MIQNNGQNEISARTTFRQASFTMPRLGTADILEALEITVKKFEWAHVARSGVFRGADAPVGFGPNEELAKTELLAQIIGRLDQFGPRIARAILRMRSL